MSYLGFTWDDGWIFLRPTDIKAREGEREREREREDDDDDDDKYGKGGKAIFFFLYVFWGGIGRGRRLFSPWI